MSEIFRARSKAQVLIYFIPGGGEASPSGWLKSVLAKHKTSDCRRAA